MKDTDLFGTLPNLCKPNTQSLLHYRVQYGHFLYPMYTDSANMLIVATDQW